MHTTIDLPAYLRRIGYAGHPRADLATLRALVAHHTAAIPFENLDPWSGLPPSLELSAIEDKVVGNGRGGYCFEQNALFSAVLAQLDFDVTRLAARVLWGRADDAITPRSHMLLRVDVEGGPVIADVGFGSLTLTGTLALDSDATQATPHEPFRLVACDGGWRVQAWVGDAWKSLYRFDPHPQHPIDYEAANWYLATNPASHFTQNLIATRAAPQRRYALLNRELAVHALHGGTERRTLATPQELLSVLEQDLLIALPKREALRTRIEALFA
jgi:N-hydroxyarylamine O-acetyltransferase